MRLQEHLEQEGFLFGQSKEEIEKRIKTQLSPDSLKRFQDLLQRRPYTLDDLLTVPRDIKEATLLLSPMARMTQEACEHIYAKMKAALKAGARVADVSCSIGTFDRWLAATHPEITVAGFDRHPPVLQLAKGAPKSPNLSYEAAPQGFDVAFSVLGLDVPNGLPNPHEDNLEEDDPSYTDVARTVCANAFPFFQQCRSMLQDHGFFIAVLRVPIVEHLMGLIKAASKAGLWLNLDHSDFASVLSVPHPCLVFQCAQRPLPNVDDLLDWWVKGHPAASDPKVWADAAALRQYRKLPNKNILDKQTTEYQDGHSMVQETGIAGDTGFVYEYATTLYRRLELVPLDEAQTNVQHRFAHEE